MSVMKRRTVLGGAMAASLVLAGCGNGVGSNGGAVIDQRVAETLNFMEMNYPGTVELRQNAVGMLVMPVITEGGLGFGGSYGEGALLVNDITVDYYSATQGSFGLQIGVQQYSSVLFFMTADALADFRTSNGWAAGAEVEYTANKDALNLSADTTTVMSPVIAVVFGQAGFLAGATVEGTKYSRIIP